MRSKERSGSGISSLVVRRTFTWLVLVIVGFATLHPITRWLPVPVGRGLFNLDGEDSFPTWYSSIQLAGAAGALAVMAWLTRRVGGRWWRHWVAMSGIVLYLSMDEALALHERLVEPVRALTGASSGPLRFAWVIPAGAIAVMVGLVLARFVFAQGARFARGTVLAGGIYVGGAVGLEIVAGVLLSMPQSLLVGVLVELEIALEESMEMLGAAIILCATQARILEHLDSSAEPVTQTLSA